MKILRVLTGPHAGARVAMTDGPWTVASPLDSARFPLAGTICLEGWSGEALALDVEKDVCILRRAGAGQAAVWPDLEPRSFGDTVLCIGGEGAPWPDDLTLLSALVQPKAVPAALALADLQQKPQRRTTGGRAAFVVLCVTGLLALFVASPSKSAKSPGVSSQSAARLKAAAAPPVRQAPPDNAELLDMVRSALHGHNVAVRLEGDGALVVEGSVRQPDKVREIVARLEQDLAPALKSIEVDVQPALARPRITARLETGATAYAVRPDGTKIFYP